MNQASELESLASSIHSVTSPFRSYLSDLHEQLKGIQEGKVTSYTPELVPIASDCFGIDVITTDGEEFEVGDSNQFFTLQNLANLLLYGIILEDYGREYVTDRVSIEPSNHQSYQLEFAEKTQIPKNPLSIAGAITLILVNSNDLGMIAGTLANGGVNPITEKSAIERAYVQDLLSVMTTCGLGNKSQQWLYQVGVPTQSSIGGGTIFVVPNQLGIGIFPHSLTKMETVFGA